MIGRGAADPFPFTNHRTLAETRVDRGASKFAQWGAAQPREAKARDLERRRKALGLTYERIAVVSGLYSQHVRLILSGRGRGSWLTLNTIEQALVRRETAGRRVRGGGSVLNNSSMGHVSAAGMDLVEDRRETVSPTRLKAGASA